MASGPEVPPAQAAGTEERAGTRPHLVWVTGCQLRALAMGAALSRGEQRTGPGGHGVSLCHAGLRSVCPHLRGSRHAKGDTAVPQHVPRRPGGACNLGRADPTDAAVPAHMQPCTKLGLLSGVP